jgi:hypothetical protein
MAGLKEGGVAFQRSQVVPVGSQAYVAVGADGEECASFHPQMGCRSGVEVSDGVWDVGAGSEGHSSFKQGRMFYVFLQGGVENQQRRWVCSGSAYKDQSAARTMAECVKAGRAGLGHAYRNCVGQAIAGCEGGVGVTEDNRGVGVVDVQFCLGHHIVVPDLWIGKCSPDRIVTDLAFSRVRHGQPVFHIVTGFHDELRGRPAFDFVAVEQGFVGGALMDES